MKWFLVVLMVIHGLIHLMGGVNELGLAKIEKIWQRMREGIWNG